MNKSIVLAFALLLCVSCSSQDIAGATTAAALVIVSPVAVPVSEIYHGINGVDRYLSVYEAYRIGDQKYVFRNENGWFTDQSERRQLGKNQRYQSGWIVDLMTVEKDEKGRIVLSELNLDRWYFRDNDVRKFPKLPRNPETSVAEYYVPGSDKRTIELHTNESSSYILYLKQD